MLLAEVLFLNLVFILVAGFSGWFPARLLVDRIGGANASFRYFASLLLGFLMLQSCWAIWYTRGLTMQWLNFLPVLFLFILSRNVKNRPSESFQFSLREPLILLGMVLVCSVYFVRSYSHDFQSIDRYPFVDLVTYAASAYGMGQAGSEVYFSDMALYYPSVSKLDLYHFTELWFVRMASDLSGHPDLWIVCFILPVFSLALLIVGLLAIPATRKMPGWLLFLLIFSFCFTFGKLLFFQDPFLYHVLDLFGQKISLIIPALIFLYLLRNHRELFAVFLLILPQINVLLVFPVTLLAIYWFFFRPDENSRFPAARCWLFYAFYGTIFLTIWLSGRSDSPAGPEMLPFSIEKAFITFFQYGREAIFNLGFLYWSPFLYLAAIFRSRVYTLLLIPFFLAKAIGKLIPEISPVLSTFVPAAEFLLCLPGLWWVNRRFIRFPLLASWLLLLVFLLCSIAALGYAVSGFMDFEQIYTLLASSLFFLFSFALFLLPVPEKYPPLLRFRGAEYLLGLSLFALSVKTFRFQRVLPFDSGFYRKIIKEAAPLSRSVYFTDKRFSPFPLHVKAGFPLLFYFPDAHSTPVTQFDDNSWKGKNIAWHVKKFPFYYFCSLPENQGRQLQENILGFIRKNGIRFAWVDNSYPEEKLWYLRPFAVKVWQSEQDKTALWQLSPEKIPVAGISSPASSGK